MICISTYYTNYCCHRCFWVALIKLCILLIGRSFPHRRHDGKQKEEKSKIIFSSLYVWISVASRPILWKGIKLPIYQYFCQLHRIILSRLKRNKEKYRKLGNDFFRLCVWLSVESRPIFWTALKFPIYPYFCRLGRIILSRLKKVKKNIEKTKRFFFFSLGLDIGGKEAHFLKGLKIPYLSNFCRLYQRY